MNRRSLSPRTLKYLILFGGQFATLTSLAVLWASASHHWPDHLAGAAIFLHFVVNMIPATAALFLTFAFDLLIGLPPRPRALVFSALSFAMAVPWWLWIATLWSNDLVRKNNRTL